ncbi:histidine phosphatase family protein [Bacillus cereus group sp. MYBK95-2]|uniref:histidine phosphatase family protein n=1 Tax=Bacillus cereus group sp. MYBK95-2 TaxID=3450599 RepID=UPI003F79694D|nr:histidine phosphatase family protein [Bacillus cereus]MDA2308369.1 histidine phosphatase family protein [Bacillus cereus]
MLNTESQNHEIQEYELLKEIQGGGYILYFRHAKPDSSEDILVEEGKQQAKQIGKIFQERKIPIQYQVLVSPTQRTKETGIIAFKPEHIEVQGSLRDIHYLKEENLEIEQQKIKEELIHTLETPPSDGLNKVLIAHLHLFDAAQNDLPYMGMVVLKPNGPGEGYQFKGLITLEQFMKWSDENRTV